MSAYDITGFSVVRTELLRSDGLCTVLPLPLEYCQRECFTLTYEIPLPDF